MLITMREKKQNDIIKVSLCSLSKNIFFQKRLKFGPKMSSLGYILMNWTAEFARHSKEKKELKKRKKERCTEKGNTETDRKSKNLSEAIEAAVQTEGTVSIWLLAVTNSSMADICLLLAGVKQEVRCTVILPPACVYRSNIAL